MNGSGAATLVQRAGRKRMRRSGRDNIHALRPTPEPGLLVPATVQTADGRDGLRGNVGPHRLPQVHLLVVSMEATGVYWMPVWNVLTIRAAVAAHQPGALQSGPGKEDRSKGRNAYRRTPAGRSSGRQLRAPG